MKSLLTFFLSLLSILSLAANGFSQTSYSGFIDKYPIELVTHIYGDGDVRAFYVYTKYDEPITIDGTLNDELLTLFEKDSLDSTTASLVFNDFKTDYTFIYGLWKDHKTKKELKITLTKVFEVDFGDSIHWENKELLQPVSIKDRYFKLVLSKVRGDFYAKVTSVKIFEKKTDKLIQEISNIECQLWGLDNISIDDYNFDGVIDFSIFEQSYAGPNTSRLYFLFNSKTGEYFKSSFKGTSLEFDQTTKRIYEHNQSCAGHCHMNAEYKVINNKMVLVKKTCLAYDEKTEEYINVKCE